jgi:RNA ligase (TIGR02306 family)
VSTFRVPVESITVEPHPNADALEIATIQGYQSLVRKGAFKSGDLVAYIPEASILPSALIEEMGLTGWLAGGESNRVKAIRLRGTVSQGLCYPARAGWVEGQDVAAELGIIKWEPMQPVEAGIPRVRRMDNPNAFMVGANRAISYDIEAYKAHAKRGILQEGEPVTYTEKIHGSWVSFGLMPPHLAHPEYGDFLVSSKGFSQRGLALKPEESANTWYWRAAREFGIEAKLRKFAANNLAIPIPVFVIGEVFGQGVQDLDYGQPLTFRAFDVFVGSPNPEAPEAERGNYLGDDGVDLALGLMELERVPVLYRGPWSMQTMRDFTDGRETISGGAKHIREGIVVRPVAERTHPVVGRVILKSVSADYLLRKNGTEYQ